MTQAFAAKAAAIVVMLCFVSGGIAGARKMYGSMFVNIAIDSFMWALTSVYAMTVVGLTWLGLKCLANV